jgi:septal ring factor EnvC (AmiA/AmiB activator)
MLISLSFLTSTGQETREDLETKRKKLESEIAYTNKLIAETRKSKQSTVGELRLLNSRINQRNDLVATLKKEIDYLERQIDLNESMIGVLNKELKKLIDEYTRLVYIAYKHHTPYNKLIYIFSAEDLNQAYQRIRYIDQLSTYIRNESKAIRKKEAVKTGELQKLNDQKADKKKLLDAENEQVSRLERERIQKDELMSKLSGQEKQLQADLKKKEKESRQLAKQIEEIIAREMKPKKDETGKKTYALTPEEQLISDSFFANKGKLPWPVDRGVVSESFGVHQHPVLKNVKTKNNGLNIATSPETEARCIFNGEVVSIAKITTTNNAIIVKHGEYFSVYSNLDEVFVGQGENVNTKQSLGRVHTNLKGKTELHFEVWKGKQVQNPVYWITNK